jgi:CheY-like chemotaxis protein
MDRDTTKRALVIDDEESIRNYVRYLLEAAGYEVADADNGTRGLLAAVEAHFDLIVTDISMPGLDGVELIREVRARGIRSRVIAMSGAEKADTLLRIAGSFDADAIVEKPFTCEDLLSAVDGGARARHSTYQVR